MIVQGGRLQRLERGELRAHRLAGGARLLQHALGGLRGGAQPLHLLLRGLERAGEGFTAPARRLFLARELRQFRVPVRGGDGLVFLGEALRLGGQPAQLVLQLLDAGALDLRASARPRRAPG